jgi:hypothetical protein
MTGTVDALLNTRFKFEASKVESLLSFKSLSSMYIYNSLLTQDKHMDNTLIKSQYNNYIKG